MDEARFGLKVTHRRLWCPFGSRPPWIHDHQYHWFWLYAAVEPVSGTCFVLFLPHVDGICFERFLEELRQHTGADPIGLVLDNSGSHTSGKVRWPEGIAKIPLPPYSPVVVIRVRPLAPRSERVEIIVSAKVRLPARAMGVPADRKSPPGRSTSTTPMKPMPDRDPAADADLFAQQRDRKGRDQQRGRHVDRHDIGQRQVADRQIEKATSAMIRVIRSRWRLGSGTLKTFKNPAFRTRGSRISNAAALRTARISGTGQLSTSHLPMASFSVNSAMPVTM